MKVGPEVTRPGGSVGSRAEIPLWLGVPRRTHFIGRASANSQRFHHQAPLKALHLRGVIDAHLGLFALLCRVERRAPLAARAGERRLLHRPPGCGVGVFLGTRFPSAVPLLEPKHGTMLRFENRRSVRQREALSQARPPAGSATRVCADGGAAGAQYPPARRGRGGPGGAETRVSGPTPTRAGRASGCQSLDARGQARRSRGVAEDDRRRRTRRAVHPRPQ